MNVLSEISEGTLGIGEYERLGERYVLRKSARAILLDSEGKMAVQYLQTYHYHKLPGGGVDPGETVEEALRREVQEEVGCQCAIVNPVGMVIEYRNKYNLLHLSYCFVARVVGQTGIPELEEGEIEEGQITKWISPEEMLEYTETDVPGKFEGHFICARENAFLREYLQS